MIYLLSGLAALCAAVLYIAARAGDDKGEDMPNFYYNDNIDWEDRILARQEAREIWEDQDPLEDDLDDFLREIYDDLGYDDEELAEMLEDWEGESDE